MPKIDPEQEKRRVTEFYSQQMDGELEKVAGQAYELTDTAREALRAELAKRGLTPRLVEQAPAPVKKEVAPQPGDPPLEPPETDQPESPEPAHGEVEFRELVTIRQFRDLPEALLAKGSLASAGIDAVLLDDNLVRIDWFWSNLIGGVKLQVPAEDSQAANEILNQPIPENFDATGTGDYQQPRCPKCGSLDVTLQELHKPLAFGSAYLLSLPIPVHRGAWRCRSCKVNWEDEGLPDQPEVSP
jgi:hypothetical protein